MRTFIHSASSLVLLVSCAGAVETKLASAPLPPKVATPLFEFHSDPWVNLHQRLLAEATANSYWHTTVSTCACARGADGTTLPAWSAAVAGYKTELEGRSPVFDSKLAATNLALALAGTRPTLPKDGIDPIVAKWIAPSWEAYVRDQWPADDARNKAWIAAVEPLVARWGREIADELAKRFHITWPGRPIRVEVTQYAGFGGAYTTSDPILTTMSSDDPGYVGPAALEMLFHEASHGLDGILTHDLQMAFIARGKREPRSLDHAIIFYTAGELTRRRFLPDYVPYAYKHGLYKRGGFERYEPAIRVHWQAWLDDRIDFATALDRIAEAVPE